jgi:hypothetical protein
MRISYLILFAIATTVAAQSETRREKFFALGGRETPAKIIAHGVELTTDDIAQGRDLSSYDQAGFFDCRSVAPPPRPHCELETIRKFIWEHWQAKRRGYIRVTWNSVDATSTSHVFIEPAAEGGSWHVTWRIVRDRRFITELPDITSVAWVPRTENDEAGEKILVFRHANHEEIQRL